MPSLKNYQKIAIDDLKDYFKLYIKKDNKQIVFKSPTGSGKTFIITKLLEDICQDNQYEDLKLAFIWISIGTAELHKQSFDKVRKDLNGSPDCELLTPAYLQSHDHIEDRQIVFANWEKLIQKVKGSTEWKNSMMKDQEGRNFLELIDNTRDSGAKIILIVDESHIGKNADTRISQFKNEIINPDLTIEMSATPNEKADVEVDVDDVIAEGMIKEELVINRNIKANADNGLGRDTITLVLEKAEEQRRLLAENFKKVGANVNPLVLVQIPNTDLGDETMEITENFLRGEGITEENGLLVKWFADEHNFDTKKLVKNNSPVEYLIFKTAVDTGWDCPRAHILVKFREVNSNTAKIQTIGRILRTPEAKKYNNSILDKGYVFTNMEYIDPREEDYNPNNIKDVVVHIKKEMDKSLSGLESFYKSRVKSYNAADTRIYNIIEGEFCDYCGIGENDYIEEDQLEELGFDPVNDDYSRIIGETSASIQTLNSGERIGGGVFDATVKSSPVEIRAKVEDIIAENLNGLARARSVSPIEQALQRTITNHIAGITRSKAMEYSLLFVVRNEEKMRQIINNATMSFREEYPDLDADGSYNPFEISDEKRYSSYTYEEVKSALSLYEQMYLLKDNSTSDLEKRFLQELDTEYCNDIEWVWHNGSEPNVENFGIEIESFSAAFRPDFIVKFKDGRIGIFDTKPTGNYMFDDVKKKAKALYDYVKENREKGINVFGGIIVESNNHFYINQCEDYQLFAEHREDFTDIRSVF